MTGVHKFKIANCFVVPQGHFFGKACAFPQGLKLAIIPDIHRVARLGDRSRHRPTSSIYGVVALDDFNSHGPIAQTCAEVS